MPPSSTVGTGATATSSRTAAVQDDPYLLEPVRYIHLDPVRAGVVVDLDALDAFPWTGHAPLIGRANAPWQEVDEVLAVFGCDPRGSDVVAARAVAGSLAIRRAGLRATDEAAELGVTPRALARVLGAGATIASQRGISISNRR